jgi:arsenate reductase
MITLFGIPNCDKVRNARAFLEERGTDYHFHDFRRAGIETALLEAWCLRFGWEHVLNRAGTTFRKLEAPQRDALDEQRAIALMLAQPAMIKRPVLDLGSTCLLGFEPAAWEAALQSIR